ncbi:hypothetical protein L841_1564 [Mycobacterium sp. MAC_080597_8934]|nr:hypothetical protein L839_4244 [Mycobacterium avium MAV_120809_2495]ETZ55428.1 hypothetical protein L840_4152 [Mycobacterium sp. MAC_011194_8550]ETZ68996.1 hypothetical protein L841_1564 [Mycobacterium sp. MAC_080597_8934]
MPPLPKSAERGACAGTDAAGVCCASVIADKTAAVSQAAGEYRITTDAVRG